MTKKNTRKVAATTLSAALAASAIVPAAVAAESGSGFSDVPAGIWYEDAVNKLADENILEGPGDGTFNPGGKVDRAQASQVLYKALGLPEGGNTGFEDVDEDKYYLDAVNAVVEAGIFKGTDIGFEPHLLLDRAQAAKVIVEAYGLEGEADLSGFADEDDIPGWAKVDDKDKEKNYMAIAVENGVIDGKELSGDKPYLAPRDEITRAEFATMIHRTIENDKDETPKEDLEVDSLEAVNNADGTATISGKATGAEEVEIKISSRTTGESTTATAEVKADGTYKYTSNDLAVGGYEVEVSAVRGDDKSDSKKTTVAITSSETGVAGVVTETKGGETVPVRNVTVSAGGHETTTDANGFYYLQGIDGDKRYDVKFEKEGYQIETAKNVRVVSDKTTVSNEKVQALAIEQVKGQFNVVDSVSGEAIENAAVTVEAFDEEYDGWLTVGAGAFESAESYSFGNSGNPGNVVLDPTGENGPQPLEFGGTYRITVDVLDYKSQTTEVKLADNKNVNSLKAFELDAVAEMNITGNVKQGTLNQNNATVEIYTKNGVQVPNTEVPTNDAGNYNIEDVKLQSGEYYALVNSDGLVGTQAFTVEEGKDAAVDVNLDKGAQFAFSLDAPGDDEFSTETVSFTLKNAAGEVVARDTNSADSEDRLTATFEEKELPEGKYTVNVSGNHVVSKSFDVEITQNDIEKYEGTEALTVKEEGYAQLAGTFDVNAVEQYTAIKLFDANGNEVKEQNGPETSFTGLAEGDYTAKAFKYLHKSKETETANAVTAKQNTEAELELEQKINTGEISGLVRKAGSLAPTDDVKLSVYTASGDRVEQDVTVGENGKYEINDLKPGAYTLVTRSDNFETEAQTVTVASGEKVENLNFTLDAGANADIEVSVVDQNNKEVTTSTINLWDGYADMNDPTNEGYWNLANGSAQGDLSAGNYDIDVSATDYVGATRAVQLNKSDSQDIIFTLHDATYDVEVRAESATEGVVAAKDESGNIVAREGMTGTSTKLELPSGTFTVGIYVEGHFVEYQEVTVGNEDITLPIVSLEESERQ